MPKTGAAVFRKSTGLALTGPATRACHRSADGKAPAVSQHAEQPQRQCARGVRWVRPGRPRRKTPAASSTQTPSSGRRPSRARMRPAASRPPRRAPRACACCSAQASRGTGPKACATTQRPQRRCRRAAWTLLGAYVLVTGVRQTGAGCCWPAGVLAAGGLPGLHPTNRARAHWRWAVGVLLTAGAFGRLRLRWQARCGRDLFQGQAG